MGCPEKSNRRRRASVGVVMEYRPHMGEMISSIGLREQGDVLSGEKSRVPVTTDEFRRPAVGVAGVVWKGDKILLVQRAKEPRKGEWSLPGGHQEWGETVREAVLREVREETMLDVEVTGLLDVVDGIVRDTDGQVEYHFTLVDFRCNWLSGEPVAGDDAAAVRWITLDELEGLELWEETGRIIRMSIQPDPGPNHRRRLDR